MRTALIPLAVAAGCGSEASFVASPRCDGIKQKDEKYVDSPFDADGDGFFDSSVPDCKETYAREDLDCDDRDASTHPGMEEIGCNGVDDDCDPGTADEVD
ncbi:MAG: putative metal-binding motif-containing protein, partial [Myxococcota bacterium]|nr:putative metal-binding motif-containing protein [Myxococcota bacterium]